MFTIYENNQKISGACRSFMLCLDYVVISPFIYFKSTWSWILQFCFTRHTPNKSHIFSNPLFGSVQESDCFVLAMRTLKLILHLI